MSASVAGAARGPGEVAGPGAERMADALARAFALWRSRNYARRREAVAAIAHSAGFSVATLDNSIDALLKPFTAEALKSFAALISVSGRTDRPKTIGFIAAGNVAGAGIHEIAIALIAGARVIVKTASAEPIFFAQFARTLAEIDPDAAARIEVVHWSRARVDLTAALIANCERVVVYGDDLTIESLHRPNVIGFGSRVSAAVVAEWRDRSVANRRARGGTRARCRIVRATRLPLAPPGVRRRFCRRRGAGSGGTNVGGAREPRQIDASCAHSLERRRPGARGEGACTLARDCGRAGRAV